MKTLDRYNICQQLLNQVQRTKGNLNQSESYQRLNPSHNRQQLDWDRIAHEKAVKALRDFRAIKFPLGILEQKLSQFEKMEKALKEIEVLRNNYQVKEGDYVISIHDLDPILTNALNQ